MYECIGPAVVLCSCSFFFRDFVLAEILLANKLTSLSLGGRGSTGTIPSVLWELTKLVSLFYCCCLRITVLATNLIKNVSVFDVQEYLYLHDNALTGSIGTELSMLSEMKLLSLESNRLTGSISPIALSSLSNLEMLYLHDNVLTGTLPPIMAQLGNLSQLTLSDTFISGTLPSELLLMDSLKLLTVHHTSLEGSIPDNLCPAVQQDENECSTIDVYWEKCRYQWSNESVCLGSSLCGCNCDDCE